MRCDNRDDLLHPRFSSKTLFFFWGLCITQSNIYDEAFIAKIVNARLLFEHSSKILFL